MFNYYIYFILVVNDYIYYIIVVIMTTILICFVQRLNSLVSVSIHRLKHLF